MPERVFSYGTLRLARVQQELYGRDIPMVSDRLVGYRLDTIMIENPLVVGTSGLVEHPILRATGDPADVIDGVVLELSPEELIMTDTYEEDDYIRVVETLESGTQAWVYIAG